LFGLWVFDLFGLPGLRLLELLLFGSCLFELWLFEMLESCSFELFELFGLFELCFVWVVVV